MDGNRINSLARSMSGETPATLESRLKAFSNPEGERLPQGIRLQRRMAKAAVRRALGMVNGSKTKKDRFEIPSDPNLRITGIKDLRKVPKHEVYAEFTDNNALIQFRFLSNGDGTVWVYGYGDFMDLPPKQYNLADAVKACRQALKQQPRRSVASTGSFGSRTSLDATWISSIWDYD